VRLTIHQIADKEYIMRKRFNKQSLITELIFRARMLNHEYGFDPYNGTAQLRPRGFDADTERLIDRAVAYGRWRELQGIAYDVEVGSIGTSLNTDIENT
jgi:hypothetical protein